MTIRQHALCSVVSVGRSTNQVSQYAETMQIDRSRGVERTVL